MTKKVFLSSFITIAYCMICYSQKGDTVKNYLNFPTTINFENKEYTLIASSHPSSNYYKQDYIVLSEKDSNFNTKIYFEVSFDNIAISDIVNKKVAAIERQKNEKTIVERNIYRKDGAFMIHFMILKLSEDKESAISASRYVNLFKSVKDKKTGKDGIILFGFAASSKGQDYDDPDIVINAMRDYLLKDITSFKIPEILLIE